jgi:hypothetical protein
MNANRSTALKERVIRAAEYVQEVKGYVSPIELLMQMGFLAPAQRARGAVQREMYGGNIKKTDVF